MKERCRTNENFFSRNVITFSKRLSDRYSGSHALGNVFNAETCRLRDKSVSKLFVIERYSSRI